MRAISCTIDEVLTACELMVDRYTVASGPLWPETEQAIRAAPFEGAEMLRRTLNVGSLMLNAAQCFVCDEIVESVTRHDFSTCSCGNVSVDGGTWYARRLGQSSNFKNIIDTWPWLRDTEVDQ